MIELLPFTKLDFDTFKGWISNAEELYQFAGPIFTFPLTDRQLLDYISMTDKQPMKVVLQSNKETIGHCELNFENGNHRLSRILVGKKELRGQKMGEHIVKKMVEMLFQDVKVKMVDLNVFDWNKAAIKCYENVGFAINHNNSDQMAINGKTWTRLNMQLLRERFL